MTHSCESSRARARLLSGTLPIHPPSCGHTHDVKDRVQNNNNNNTIWGGSVLTGEEPPPHSGELKHALSQAGGPFLPDLFKVRYHCPWYLLFSSGVRRYVWSYFASSSHSLHFCSVHPIASCDSR